MLATVLAMLGHADEERDRAGLGAVVDADDQRVRPAEVPASPRPRLTSVSSRFMGGRQWVAGIVVLVTLGVMLWLFNRMRREG